MSDQSAVQVADAYEMLMRIPYPAIFMLRFIFYQVAASAG
jgi:hypothetical protein